MEDHSSLLQRQQTLQGQIQRLQGQREQAEAELARLDAECRKRGVEPENLEKVLEDLQKKYTAEVQQLEQTLAEQESRVRQLQAAVR